MPTQGWAMPSSWGLRTSPPGWAPCTPSIQAFRGWWRQANLPGPLYLVSDQKERSTLGCLAREEAESRLVDLTVESCL